MLEDVGGVGEVSVVTNHRDAVAGHHHIKLDGLGT